MQTTRAGRGFRAAAALVCALLIAASPVFADASGPARTNLQVTLWRTGYPGERELLSELVFSFQRANPDVIVALGWEDAELADEWARRWSGGFREHAPDVTVMSELSAYLHRDELVELPADLRARLRDDYDPSVVRRARGAPRGIPWSVATPALYYRPDLFEAAGISVPRTLDELVAAAAELAEPPERYGLGVPGPGGGGESLLHALALAHGPLRERHTREEDTQAADQQEAEEEEAAEPLARALGTLIQMQAAGALQPEVLTWGESELVELFAEGRLAMMIAQPRVARMLRGTRGQNREPIEWATAPMPMTGEGLGQVEVEWLVVFANSQRRENALRFLRYMSEQESQRALAMLPSVPATRALARELAGTQPWLGHIPTLSGGEGVPLSTWERFRRELADAFAWAVSGRLGPEAALEHARR